MTIRNTVVASVFVTITLTSPLALAQQADANATERARVAAEKKKPQTKADRKVDKTTDSKAETNAQGSSAQKSDDTGLQVGRQTGNSDEPSRDRPTDSMKQVPTTTTTVAGQKATNHDQDLDMSVGKAELTSAEPGRRDVIESRAEARREGEGRRVTVAPLLGYGFNDLGVGVGARAGYTFDIPVYVGGTFMYHTGTDKLVDRPGVTESSSSFLYPALEVGYDIGIGPVLLRPYAGAGVLFGRMSTTTNGVSATDTERAFMLYPGATASYLIGRSPVFVGGDTRVLLPLENQGISLTLLATAGLHL